MKFLLVSFSVLLLLICCSDKNKDLVRVINDYNIDLRNIDSVRNNLNGFWISEVESNYDNIVWLNFEENLNYCSWNRIQFSNSIKSRSQLGIPTCQPLIDLLKPKDSVIIHFVSMAGEHSSKIECMTTTTFRIDGVVYHRHKGYDFLK